MVPETSRGPGRPPAAGGQRHPGPNVGGRGAERALHHHRLSRTIDTVVNLNVTFTNGYGQDHSAQVTITGSNQAGFTVQTSRSASSQHGVVTVTLEEGAGYVPGDPDTAHAGVSRRPEPPVFHSAPTVEPVSTTRIRVTWPEPDSDHLQVTGYGVQYRKPGQDWRHWGHAGTSREATIGNLVVNTAYEVRVNAASQAGTGEMVRPRDHVDHGPGGADQGRPEQRSRRATSRRSPSGCPGPRSSGWTSPSRGPGGPPDRPRPRCSCGTSGRKSCR